VHNGKVGGTSLTSHTPIFSTQRLVVLSLFIFLKWVQIVLPSDGECFSTVKGVNGLKPTGCPSVNIVTHGVWAIDLPVYWYRPYQPCRFWRCNLWCATLALEGKGLCAASV
jgi:hypothetical protein